MAYPFTSGMIQASSSLHGSIIRNPQGFDMPSDLDQALFFYFGCQEQDKQSSQEEPHKPLNFVKETLNIFPSQPMHGEPTPTATPSSAPPVAGSSSRRSPPPSAGRPRAVGREPCDRKEGEGSRRGGGNGGGGATAASTSSELEGPRTPDPRTLRRLAQNREAARKSRLRKKAYIQQLETGRIRLAHLEQEMQFTRAQGALWGAGTSPDAAWFSLEYQRWQEAQHGVIGRLRAAVEEHRPDGELQRRVDEALSHYGALMGQKARLAGGDPLHLLTGPWKGAVERCFLWIGGFRPSDLVQVVLRHVEPLTEQQLAAVHSAQQAARREEDALDGALQALLRSLADAVSSDSPATAPPPWPQTPMIYYHHDHHPAAAAMAASFTGQSCTSSYSLQLAMDKLASLPTFLRQADELRLRTLHTLRQMLTVRQAARCFVAVDDYFGRLRALSLFWTTSRQPTTSAARNGISLA
uniref:DOG1 domain-containing protein n=1 Tax=Oryza brachyantha TaxID=4533 RepID=J3MFV0_ORYBR